MKRTFTRILAMLLCLVLTFGLCAGMVQATAAENATAKLAAENATQVQKAEEQTSSDAIVEGSQDLSSVGAEEATEGELLPYTYVNPIYGNTVNEEQAQLASVKLAAPSTYHTSLNSCREEVRSFLLDRSTSFQVGYKSTTALTQLTFNDFVNSFDDHTGNPKGGDYLAWNGYWCSVNPNTQTSGSYYVYTFTVTATYYTTKAQEQAVDAEVKRLLNTLPVKGVSDYKKVKAVYDYMCANIVYDYDGLNAGTNYCHTAHSAFIAHKTVCQGYASMFYRMMLELGIDARVIAGDANYYSTGPNSGNDEHGWNIVKLNGKYYNLDSTWDAGVSPSNYEYFLVCDANFPNHQPWSEYKTSSFKSQYPKATKDFNPATDDTTPAKSGWVLENNKWYYYQNGVKKTGWLEYGKDWYYLDGNGAMMTGWLQYGSIWYYFLSDGKMATGKVTIGNEVHIFDASGVWKGKDASATVTAGWKQEGGKWYYYKNGAKVTGWLDLNGTWYYFKTSGEMVTGWLEYGPVWYYFNTNGDMRLGWLTYGGKNYYFDKATTNYGRMAVNKWIQDSGKWYYFDANGYMVTGTVTIDGKQHKFSSTGVWEGEVVTNTNGWKQEGGKWYYYKNGVMAIGWWEIDGEIYYFDHNSATLGQMWYSIWIRTPDGSVYYAGPEGAIYRGGWYTIGGKSYYFYSDGECSNPPSFY